METLHYYLLGFAAAALCISIAIEFWKKAFHIDTKIQYKQ